MTKQLVLSLICLCVQHADVGNAHVQNIATGVEDVSASMIIIALGLAPVLGKIIIFASFS
jgi:hypothetical protein